MSAPSRATRARDLLASEWTKFGSVRSTYWALLVAGFRQRLEAFEHFLADVYGAREILRAGRVPIHAVLGSPHYQGACMRLPCPRVRP